MGLNLSTETGHKRVHPGPVSFPRPGLFARRVGGVKWWRLRHRGATPSGAIDTANATRTVSGRGSGNPVPTDSRTMVVVVRG